ncbi:hypothetical protein [Nitrosovibrio sp. Nv4]|uniref:hypothetical protein n=1 Tax=Nitrosovibrio sp. Nv4 TaxID=1945880 RepID=UPI000BC919C7|nr:hypothetical protein [Nitrosovibrio sp. Nv4]SOD41053.1 hypothetical protein SAMN06298226_1342 [Nitrosovibrio sp. Nv4]
MKFSSTLAAGLLGLTSILIFSAAGTRMVHAGERDMPAEIAPADSPAVRDKENQNGAEKEKQPKNNRSSSTRRDNSRYSTDGIERYDEDEEYSGTGPKREGRY